MNEATISQRMGMLAEAAVAFAQERYKVNLDYSEQSVEEVERILDHLQRRMPRKWMRALLHWRWRKRIDYYSFLLGAYLGEVMRRRWSGRWTMETKASSLPTVTLRVGGIDVFPPAKVYKRLTSGPEDDVWTYYRVLKGQLKG